MLRMPVRILENLVRLLLVVAMVHLPSLAKCVSLQITLEGVIERPTKGLKIVVEVGSATNGDSVTDVRQESSVKESRFRALAWFNTTSNVVSVETCDRRPHLVTVKLIQGEQVLDRQTLTVETDFRRTKKGDYELKKPITLHATAAVAAPVT